MSDFNHRDVGSRLDAVRRYLEEIRGEVLEGYGDDAAVRQLEEALLSVGEIRVELDERAWVEFVDAGGDTPSDWYYPAPPRVRDER